VEGPACYTVRMSQAADTIDAPDRRPAPSLRDGAAYPLLVFVALRVIISIAGVAFVGNHPPNPSATGPGAPPTVYTQPATTGLHNAVDGMQRWDAAWFEWIAAEGYGPDDARGAFFPGYPLLIGSVDLLTPMDGAAAATSISNLAFALSLVVLFALTRFEFGSVAAARRAVVLFACLPTSFFFLAPLSEAPFLLAVLLAFYWARTGRWGWRVAVAGFAACLIRSLGVALVAALVLEAVRQHRVDGSRRATKLIAAASGLLAPAAYVLWWWVLRGEPLQPLHAQATWQRELTFPVTAVWEGLRDGLRAATSGTHPWLLVDAVIATLALAGAVLVWRRLAASYTAFVWASLLIPLSYAAPWRPLLSIPRFAAVLFPVAWVAEDLRRQAFTMLAIICLVFQLALAVQFMNWGWIW
jgi:hypothetical protein